MRLGLLLAFVLLPLTLAAQEKKPLTPEQAKEAFRKQLERPKVPLDARQEKDPQEVGNFRIELVSIASEKKVDGTIERVPLRMVQLKEPRKSPRPVMILLHGTGGNKEGMESWLEEFASLGFLAVAIDARYHGARVPEAKGAEAYVKAIIKAWQTPAGQAQEHPFYYDTVWDLWRVLDYLEKRPDVDAKRIGMLGISMGGIQTYLAAAVDDRVAVALPLIAVQSFKWSLENDQWAGRANTIKAAHEAAAKDLGEDRVNQKVCRALWNKIIPGILDDFDCPNLLPLFVGRPLFIANGELDPNCPIEGAKLAMDAATKAYKNARCEEKLVIRINKGIAHKVTDEDRKQAVAFAQKWLLKADE
ncbi:MAG: acetylxylan esterase [Gemmataceae bacterium]|jgi:dienelactone hydrolase|nr:acetylxylan esterase [Gemmataceae bacterium]